MHKNKFPNLGVYHTTFPNLKGPMAPSQNFQKITTVTSIVYIVGLKVKIFKNIVCLFSKIDSVLASSANPDEFHMGLRCLPKYMYMYHRQVAL